MTCGLLAGSSPRPSFLLFYSAFGDVALNADGIAGLDAPGCEAKMRANRLRFGEPMRVVDLVYVDDP